MTSNRNRAIKQKNQYDKCMTCLLKVAAPLVRWWEPLETDGVHRRSSEVRVIPSNIQNLLRRRCFSENSKLPLWDHNGDDSRLRLGSSLTPLDGFGN